MPPLFDELLRLLDGCKSVSGKALVPEPGVEGLDETILLELSRLRECQCNIPHFRPFLKLLRAKLRAIVKPDF